MRTFFKNTRVLEKIQILTVRKEKGVKSKSIDPNLADFDSFPTYQKALPPPDFLPSNDSAVLAAQPGLVEGFTLGKESSLSTEFQPTRSSTPANPTEPTKSTKSNLPIRKTDKNQIYSRKPNDPAVR